MADDEYDHVESVGGQSESEVCEGPGSSGGMEVELCSGVLPAVRMSVGVVHSMSELSRGLPAFCHWDQHM